MPNEKRPYSKLTNVEKCIVNTHVDEALNKSDLAGMFKDSKIVDQIAQQSRDTVLKTIGIDQLLTNMIANPSHPLHQVPSICAAKGSFDADHGGFKPNETPRLTDEMKASYGIGGKGNKGVGV
jgi:hypothetical protein